MKREPDTDAADLFSFARDYLHAYLPKTRGLSAKTIQAYRISLECFLGYLAEAEHLDRAQVSFEHFDRAHLKAWLAWMRTQRGYAPRTITLRLTAIKTFLAYSAEEDVTLIALSQAAKTLQTRPAPRHRSNTSPGPRPEPCWPRTPAPRPSPAATGCCSSCSMTPPPGSARSPP